MTKVLVLVRRCSQIGRRLRARSVPGLSFIRFPYLGHSYRVRHAKPACRFSEHFIDIKTIEKPLIDSNDALHGEAFTAMEARSIGATAVATTEPEAMAETKGRRQKYSNTPDD